MIGERLPKNQIGKLFLKSEYFTEKNILEHPEEFEKIFDIRNGYLAHYLKHLREEDKPDWLKDDKMSDDLKLWMELSLENIKESSHDVYKFSPRDKIADFSCDFALSDKKLRKLYLEEFND